MFRIALCARAGATAGLWLLSLASPAVAHADTVDVVDWDAVADCESSGHWHAHTGNGYQGGLQFKRSTWKEYGGKDYAPRADLATRREQIRIAKRVLAHQGPSAWPHCFSDGLPDDADDADHLADAADIAHHADD
ncbi:transglycosylase family protein [Streptomyces humicola]|uniref:transglycosylase family protein n=1 Tax=Streptomyces humicola TaxID=2953240 RepID=UPI0022B279A1|nr:transglycosylase family protein [Streptomyces humicola]